MDELDIERDDETTARDAAGGRSRVTFGEHINLSTLPYNLFVERLIDARLPHAATLQWSTEVESVEDVLPYALATGRSANESAALLDLASVVGGDCLAYVYLSHGIFYGLIASRELPVVAEAERWLRDGFPTVEPSDEQQVPIMFWSLGSYGAHAVARSISVPAWEEISANYPGGVRGELEVLMGRAFRPASGGQLVLWHGPPGTGKTHALRALAWEWRKWCEVHYVTDPEDFFGRSNYMLEVLLREADDGEDEDDNAKWRLLVLEDTGELLASDAKERTGQGLSRLLNVVDGIVGQGLRVLVLVTANEPLKRMHPAIARPGRCAALIEFKGFSAEEAGEWLAGHGVDAAPGGATLAELYARAAGRPVPAPQKLGF